MATPPPAEAASPRRKFDLGEISALFGYVRPWRGRFTLAMVALLISMSFGLLFPLLMGRLMDVAIPSKRPIPMAGWHANLNTVALLLLGTLAIQAVLTFFYSYTFNYVGENAVVQLRRRLYSTLLSLPLKFYGEHRVGELTSRLSNDLALVGETLSSTVPQALRQVLMLSGGVVAILLISPRLSLVMVSSFPVLLLVAVIFGRKVRKISRDAQDRLAESATIVEETLQGITNVKAFTNERYEVDRYGSGLDAYLQTTLKSVRHRAGLVSFIILGIFGSITLVMWYGATLMQRGQLTHGQLTTFTLYTLFVGGAVSSFAEVFSQIQRTLGAHERVRELLLESPEFSDAPAGPGTAPTLDLRGEVRFDHVSFSYPSRADLPVLRDLSLVAKPGEKIALVGPSGAGKSTIVSLLLRFYEPNAGQLLFNGVDAATLDLTAVRRQMAIVPQEVLLFGGSIRDNIAYGRPGATEAEVLAASQRAHCHEFVSRFPEGYETLVGERGVKLSGGQRQRIAIARALLKDPAILILDEATSALDSESEALIQQALTELLRGRTAFIIAHRLSTVRQCDRICVIEQGVLIESGTHAELMERPNGVYRRIAELQFTALGQE